VSIVSRDMKFELTERIPSHWVPEQPEFSHVASAFMAALPHLEPYFIHNLREARSQLTDASLLADIDGFIHQEARHAQQHRLWNQVLAARYPGFGALEHAIKARLAESKRKHSLRFRLAYTSGYEAITYQLVCFLMIERHVWLQGADPDLLGMLSWHAAEEVEHKSVAFDVYQAFHGGYWLRVWGLLVALMRTFKDIRVMTRHMLRADAALARPESRKRLRRVRLAMARGVLPELRHYFKPGYRPSQHADPPLVLAWLAQHRAGRDLHRLDMAALDSLQAGLNRAS
jgi:uncharacterized protein